MRSFLVLCVSLSLVAHCVGQESEEVYENTRVYKVKVQNDQQYQALKKCTKEMQLQLLKNANGVLDIVVSPDQHVEFETRLIKLGIPFEVMISDLKSVLEARNAPVPKSQMEWTQYHTLDEIYEWLDYISVKHPDLIRRYTIGTSYEGRPIKALKLSRRSGNKALFMECNMHAVEWISSAACTCLLNNLLYSEDMEVHRLTWDYDFIFVPVMNPDGFEYTHTKAPLWRKNRRPTGFSNSSGPCIGIDMNRNFDFEWNVAGHNVEEPCDHWYSGPAAGSESEVQALKRFVSSFTEDSIRIFLAVHAYGNFLLLPFGHTVLKFPLNYNQMLNISSGFAQGARKRYGTEYSYGASGLLLNPVSGSSKDWAYGVKNIPYSATIELRDNGMYGFFLPANEIKEVCAELTDGILSMLKVAKMQKLFD